jgi:selenocysteine-specific elongation factor
MKHKTIAVIGHVDHGKTSLVKALTGVDTDTLAEERERGLSISLGFAHRDLPGGKLHLVDAPGHADFVRTTASGLSGIDTVLLALSAADGVQAQTREHLQIARALGVRHVLVALTKADLVGEEDIQRARAEIETLLMAQGLVPVEIVACSSRAQDGIDSLVSALDRALNLPEKRSDLPGFFLPIDRVFTAVGAGTIVTGTLIGHALAADAAARVEPEGRATSIRSVQIAGAATELAPPGARVAVGLRGVDKASIHKGSVICAPGCFIPSRVFDVCLNRASMTDPAPNHMDQVMVMLGTAYEPARVRLLAKPSTSDEDLLVQLAFDRPQVGFRGQRFVLRNPAAAQTLCGGTIIDPAARLVPRNKPLHLAVLRAAAAGDAGALAHALADRDQGAVSIRELARLCGQASDALTRPLADAFELASPEHAFRKSDIKRVAEGYVAALAALHEARPIRPHHPVKAIQAALPHMPAALLRHVESGLLSSGRVRQHESALALTDHDPFADMTADQHAAYTDAEQRLRDLSVQPGQVFDPKSMTSEQADIIALMIAHGVAIRLFNHALKQHVLLHSEAIAAACAALQSAFPDGARFTTGEARNVLNTNRKIIVPLLEHFDARAITRRAGDTRHFPD